MDPSRNSYSSGARRDPPLGQLYVQILTDQRLEAHGKIYGPYFKGEVVVLPEDVAKQLIMQGVARKSLLTPEDVDRTLWNTFASILREAELNPAYFRREFYQLVDATIPLENSILQVRNSAYANLLEYKRRLEHTRGKPANTRVTQEVVVRMPEIEGREPGTFRAMRQTHYAVLGTTRLEFRDDVKIYEAWDSQSGTYKYYRWLPNSQRHEGPLTPQQLQSYAKKAEPLDIEVLIKNGWPLAKHWAGGEEGYIRDMAKRYNVTEDYVRQVLRKYGLI